MKVTATILSILAFLGMVILAATLPLWIIPAIVIFIFIVAGKEMVSCFLETRDDIENWLKRKERERNERKLNQIAG